MSAQDCCNHNCRQGRDCPQRLMRDAAPDLLAALVWREQFEMREGENSNDRFERVAATFRIETGYLRPGKDSILHSFDEQQEAWDKWMEAGRAKVRAAIAKATGTTP